MGSLCGLGVFFAFFAVQIFSGLVIPQGVTNPTTSKIFAQGPAPARHRTVFLILPRLTIPTLLPMAVPKSGTPIGKPSGDWPTGTTAAGVPSRLNHSV